MEHGKIRWVRAAKAIGGLAAVLTLLAHFWLPELPLTLARVELLLLLIGVLLGLDMLTERVGLGSTENRGRTQEEGDSDG